jgi:hypothetical protein
MRATPLAARTPGSIEFPSMDAAIASEIARIQDQLRATIDDISARVAVGAAREHTLALVQHARELADTLERTVERLDHDDDAEGVRRMAAYLAAHLVVLERDSRGTAIH